VAAVAARILWHIPFPAPRATARPSLRRLGRFAPALSALYRRTSTPRLHQPDGPGRAVAD